MRSLHIRDLHHHRDPSNDEATDTLLKTIGEKYPDHVLIVTGEITDDGHPEQYENAFQALVPFMKKVLIVPGNHDFGAAGNFYSRERAVRFDEMLMKPLGQGGTFTGDSTPVVTVREDGQDSVMLIGLDTNLETIQPFDFACGEVGAEQLAALDTILTDSGCAGKVKILFFHHHLFMHGNPFMELIDARELLRTIYKRVDVVLFGHKHSRGKWDGHSGIPFVRASDKSPDSDWALELSVDKGTVAVQDVPAK
jgi:3',5'-cyclic AMP phosphodiesterase CpdA